MVRSWMRVQHDLLGVSFGGQLLVLLDCAKVELEGRRYDNWSIFFPWYQEAKKKEFISKIFNFDFLKTF